MDPYNHLTPTSTKLPILDTGKFEQWKFRIQQYLQHEHYALWEVIEFGDSYKAPPEETGKGLCATIGPCDEHHYAKRIDRIMPLKPFDTASKI
ncbi:hypothetical protein Tco_1366413 [Tanacetum coccineum]